MAPSIANLSEYLSKRDFGPSIKLDSALELHWDQTQETAQERPWKGQELPWNGLSCLSVVSYVLKLCSETDHDDLFDMIRRLNDLASDYLSAPHDTALVAELGARKHVSVSEFLRRRTYNPRSPENLEREREIADIFVNSFMPKVQRFFTFPPPNKNEDLASFMHFLLQILYSESDHIPNEESRHHFLHQEGVRRIQAWLTFFLAVLGDTPFQFTEMEEIKNVLLELESLANETGNFIYSCLLSSYPVNVTPFHVGVTSLLGKMDFMKTQIVLFIIKFSEFPLLNVPNPRLTDAAGVLFIIHSLLEDLKNYRNFRVQLTEEFEVIKEQLPKLHKELISARSFLKEINVPQETDIEKLKVCVIQIRDIAYEAEYLINSFVADILPAWYLAIRLPTVVHQLERIMEGCDEIRTIHGIEVLKVEDQDSSEVDQVVVFNPVTAHDNSIVGFEDEMIKILDELTRGSDNLQIITICGMPGLGKTTFARQLYNDRLIVDYFDECLWCTVSQPYQKRKVLTDMLLSSRRMHDKERILKMEDESLVLEFYRSLIGRRYLIVIDDVWDSGVWDDLRRYFPNDQNGSRILSTTRLRDTAPVNTIIHTLPLLSEDQCWELLQRKVFHNEHCPLQLCDIGKRIAAKCNGLPLAVVAIAGTLANMAKENSAWEKVEKSLNEHTGNCMKILELSYKHLPNHLKLCFLYLGVFPEDSEIPVRKLIWLWIAEGLIQKDEHKSRERVAEEYLMDLIGRSLVLVAKHRSIGGVKACSIHDLLHDMCLKKAQDENFLHVLKNNNISTYMNQYRLRMHSTNPAYVRPLSIHCRSFYGHLSDPSSCLPQMRNLRIAELSRNWSVRGNIKIIDLLVHLRYLFVDRMPTPILGNLVNLEVLWVQSLQHAVYMPSAILKLVKLRHLHVRVQLKFGPDFHVSRTNNLQTLSFLSIYSKKAYEVLLSSPHLRKLKCVCLPQFPDFRFLTQLTSIKILIRDIFQISRNTTAINFPPTLKKLCLAWTNIPWANMTTLGKLPELQALKLLEDAFEGDDWNTSDDEFKKLRFLKLKGLNLKHWTTSSEHFPRLEHLVLHKCDKLSRIPTDLGEIETMQMIEVHGCNYEASISAVQIEQEQRDNGNKELKVIISGEWSKEQLVSKFKKTQQEQQVMAFSITQLSEYLRRLDFGPSMELTLLQTEETDQSFIWEGQELPWNGLSCLSVVCYVLKFCSDTDHRDVFDTICMLNDLASEYNANPQVSDYTDSLTRLKDEVSKYEFHYHSLSLDESKQGKLESSYERMLCLKLRERNSRKLGKRREIAEMFVYDLLPKVRQFFTFSKGNENLASFIHFSLQILNCESNHIWYDGLGSRVLEGIQKWSQTSLRTSLNFLLTVLGDAPFQFTEMEQVNNIFTEFEVVANEVGTFIYLYFFGTIPVDASQFLEESVVLLQKVDLLSVKIEEHCIEFSKLPFPVYNNVVNTEAADSLFIVESLLEDLQNIMTSRDHLADEIHQTTTLHEERRLHEELVSAQIFLEDSDVPDDIDIKELKIQIRDTAYEAEYLVNSFSAGDLPLWYFSLRLPVIIQKFELIKERRKATKKFSALKLMNVQENLTVEVPSQQIVLTPGAVDEKVAIEFEDETTKILDELTGGSEDLVFICIYGMPGLGKTTLAKRLYNDRLITSRFDECAWCVASQTYHKRKVLIDILTSLRNSVDKDQISKREDNSLILEIHKTLFCRRYLIVIDDVWDSHVWNDLGRYFRNDRNGSRILFTTRIRDTAPINSLFHTPHFLSHNQCWELLENKVFHDEPCPPQLRDSGKRIAAKCNGLPLAVVVIAGTLANISKEKCAWEKVEESLNLFTSNCMEILKLSYRHLPNHLKLCFLYLGLFPEDAKIPVTKLIRLWIAEGFIRKEDNKSQENVAEDYLMDLVNRSLILVAETRSIGGVKSFSIHDLLHDMCLRISKEEDFLCLIENNHNSTHDKHRRLCVLPMAPVHLRPFSLHCRSFFGHFSDPSSCLPQMKRLKVMELALPRGTNHLNIFGKTKLIHLRYLVIDQIIPESVLDNLVNLEVLCVDNTSRVDASMIISKLLKLRHLYVKRAKFVTHYDRSKPNSLQSLLNIHMQNTNDYENLRSLPHLQKLKCQVVSLPDLSFLTELKSLEIGASTDLPYANQTINFPSTIIRLNLSKTMLPWEMMSILGKLPALQSLKLFWDAFKGKEWTTCDDEFQNLRVLKIATLDLEEWISMSEHLPRLRHLVIVSCNNLQKIPAELGDIPTLHTIELHECGYVANMSAIHVEQEQRDNGNEDLQVIITNRRWSKEELLLQYKQLNEEKLSSETQKTSSSGVHGGTFWPNPLIRMERTSAVHNLVGCDYCGMDPIVGDRYRCIDCTEISSYDLCGYCYLSTRYKLPGRDNQKHTSDHKFDIVTSNVDQRSTQV